MKFWITYAWKDNEDGDFSYLVQDLKSVGIETAYDKKVLIPGQSLWTQISSNILNPDLLGWGILLTKNSLSSKPCIEELSYALDRALDKKGTSFPLIGLLHGISISDVPQALRVRLCVSMADQNWKEMVRAGLEKRPPNIVDNPQSPYVTKIHPRYSSNPDLTAIEVRPRFSEVMYWRFLIPKSSKVSSWGHGPSNGGSISGVQYNTVEGNAQFQGRDVVLLGAGDKLSPSISAYVVFQGQLPDCIWFGLATEAFGNPTNVLQIKFQ